jgi:hypothetical protein
MSRVWSQAEKLSWRRSKRKHGSWKTTIRHWNTRRNLMVLRESMLTVSMAYGHQYQPSQPAATNIQGVRLRAGYQARKLDKNARPYVFICIVFLHFLMRQLSFQMRNQATSIVSRLPVTGPISNIRNYFGSLRRPDNSGSHIQVLYLFYHYLVAVKWYLYL